MPRRFDQSTFVFVLSYPGEDVCEHEERLVEVMGALLERGATVKVITQPQSALVERIRFLGIEVSRYKLNRWNIIRTRSLNRWNIIRTRSRLRKYLKRYAPPVVHTTGLWGTFLLGLASAPLETSVVLSASCGDSRAGDLIDRLVRRLVMRQTCKADFVFAESQEHFEMLLDRGIDPVRIELWPEADYTRVLLERYRTILRR